MTKSLPKLKSGEWYCIPCDRILRKGAADASKSHTHSAAHIAACEAFKACRSSYVAECVREGSVVPGSKLLGREVTMPNCTYNRDRCAVITNDGSRCSKIVSNAGFALAAHNRMHLRAGELITVSKWSWKGVALESQMIQPRDAKMYATANWFETFEKCKVAYVEGK